MPERLPQHLARFFENEKAAREEIEALRNENPHIDKGEIFRLLTENKSPERNALSHWSGHYREGKTKRRSAK